LKPVTSLNLHAKKSCCQTLTETSVERQKQYYQPVRSLWQKNNVMI
jgi:hypothetical protein